MKDIYTKYAEKLIPADVAASLVKYGDKIFYSGSVLFPDVLDAALSRQIHLLRDIDLQSVCFSRAPKTVEADPGRNHVIMNDWHSGGVSRGLHDRNLCNDIPSCYHQGPRTIRKHHHFDISFITVAEMDKNGYFNYGIANSMTDAVLNKSKTIILEVNKSVPYCYGGNRESIHISKIDYVVEGNNSPLAEFEPAAPEKDDLRIAGHIMKEIEDGACLQLGEGSLPALICRMIAESSLKDLGIHTDILTDSCVDLYHAGKITGKRKSVDPFKMAYSFARGTKKLYDFLDHNPTCASYPADYINDPKIIARNDKVVAINHAGEVDLYGQVCSESMENGQQPGTGGQLDFISGAFQSHGGKGIIYLNSTYKDQKGKLHSQIVPTLEPGSIVTVPSSIVQYVATEYGIVRLCGKSTWERADALIGIAHPDFQDALIRQADKMKIWVKGK